HMCVEATVRAAHDFGYTVILVADACTTRTLQYQDKIITAENVHLSTLKTLKGSYCTVVNTDELLKDFKNLLQADN
ncbi:MAG: isochorismatase family protein, partial [Bacteroidota bacterium]